MMTGGKKNDTDSPDDARSFADLADTIEDLERLEPGPRVSPEAPGNPRPESSAAGDASSPSSGAPGPELQFANPDEPLLGRRSSVRAREFNQLRRGHLDCTRKVDLHGADLASARRRVHAELAAAAQAGEACVLIVHGKGHHSPDGVARLREGLADWLREPALGGIVAACAPAQPRHGGRGALYVMLAR
jgi:DNA-nicking Smr family endonuclease